MYKMLLVIGVVLMSFSVQAQSLVWQSNFVQAQTKATELSKPMIIFFSGSDWCKPCIQLEKEILESPEFSAYSQKFIMYNADFPYTKKQEKILKKQNEALAEKYNPEGQFPKIVIIGADGKVLGTAGYSHVKPSIFIQQLEKKLQNG